jgi:dimethylamine monooxygenase subunit A
MRYFPFDGETYAMTMGTRALGMERVIEIDEGYREEVGLKRRLLEEDYASYFRAGRETEEAQWEVVRLLLPEIARSYPKAFTLLIDDDEWTWRNAILEEEITFRYGDASSLPYAPLDWLGRQMQEDLLLLADSEGMPLVAGQLCFPNAWCLEDKLGQSFLDIHGPVPFFAQKLGRSTSLLLERLKVDRPVGRVNWSFKTVPRLNLMPCFDDEVRQADKEITKETMGSQCWLRVERQTLTRLPVGRAILFTIHTYQTLVGELEPDEARRAVKVLRGVPPETFAYKGMTTYAHLLIEYLDGRAMAG